MTAKYDETQCRERIKRIRLRFEGTLGLHERVRWRRQHFHQLPEAKPPMPKGFEDFSKQWGDLRRPHQKLKARLMENEWLPQFTAAKSTSAGELLAERAESLFVQGFAQFQKATGISLQADMADELSISGVGVLHWLVDTSMYETLDYNESDEPDEGMTDDEYDEEATKGRKKKKAYRETEDSLADRIARNRAAKGFPVWAEVLGPEQCYWVQDKSSVSEFREFLVVREIGDIDSWTQEYLKSSTPTSGTPERDSPVENVSYSKDTTSPSAGDWGSTYTLMQYWTRTHFYELCEPKGGKGATHFRCEAHPYKMPPFALVPGSVIRNNDPALKFEPALQSLYRLKPDYDRAMSLFMILSESGAVPLYILVNKSNGQPKRLTDDGDIALFSEDSAKAMELPEGYELQRFGGDGVSKDFVQGLEFMKVLWEEGSPDAGYAQFGASTQPWSARIEQAQTNMEPKMYLTNMDNALLAMCSNLVDVFSDETYGPGTIYGWASGAGKYDTSKTEKVEPKEWAGLTVEVATNKIGSAEQITIAEHLLSLVHDELIMMTPEEYIEQAENKPNPQETYLKRVVDAYIRQNVLPILLKEAAAENIDGKYFLGPNASIYSANGQPMTPQDYLGQNGQQVGQQGGMPQGQPQARPPMQAPPMGGGGMPSMAGIAAPGTMPMAGIPG